MVKVLFLYPCHQWGNWGIEELRPPSEKRAKPRVRSVRLDSKACADLRQWFIFQRGRQLAQFSASTSKECPSCILTLEPQWSWVWLIIPEETRIMTFQLAHAHWDGSCLQFCVQVLTNWMRILLHWGPVSSGLPCNTVGVVLHQSKNNKPSFDWIASSEAELWTWVTLRVGPLHKSLKQRTLFCALPVSSAEILHINWEISCPL